MNEHKNNTGAAGGLSFCGLLTIAFIVLKLTGVIDWSWLWVLAPAWIPAAIAIAVILVVLVVVLVKATTKEVEKKQRETENSKSIDNEARKYSLERQQGESDLDLKRRIAFFKQEARRARHE
jgi:membrane protein implicated in regulation of membrane protease activity